MPFDDKGGTVESSKMVSFTTLKKRVPLFSNQERKRYVDGGKWGEERMIA